MRKQDIKPGDPVLSLTAEGVALLSDEQADQLYELVLADRRRRQDEARAEHDRKWEVLGKDATATCLAHRRPVRWLPSPCWWYHDWPGDTRPPESRQCRFLLDAKAPIVITRRSDLAAKEA